MDRRLDADLLMNWCQMETMDQYLKRNEAFGELVSNEEFLKTTDEYFTEVNKRIKHCEQLLGGKNQLLVYYTLAELYSRYDMDDLPDYPHKRKACYYAMKAIKEDRSFAPAWALMAEVYDWAVFCGGIEGVAAYRVEKDLNGLQDDEVQGVEESYLTEEYAIDSNQKKRIVLIEKAISCIKKAIEIDQTNEKYHALLKNYLHMRNEEYKPPNVFRNPAPGGM